MPQLMQQDIRDHYEREWAKADAAAGDAGGDAALTYSNPVEDAVLYPAYQRLLADVNAVVDGGAILDVGCGSGRWARYFLTRYRPAHFTGIDFTAASVELLAKRYATADGRVAFAAADITRPGLDLGRRFDLVNVMNVLFHIPEPDKFAAALANIAAHLASGGVAVSTEYLPRQSCRTDWMLVRSRYDFEAAVAAAGLQVAAVRATGFFANDPMGIDATDGRTRDKFHVVRGHFQKIMALPMNADARQFFTQVLTDVEGAATDFCRGRMVEADLPSQKLVVLRRAG